MAAADSALGSGDIERADSLYFLGVRMHPRDPAAREALGRYLGMRGASRVAVVLLEEARLFGADPARIAARLAPLYESLGDWRALLTLPSSPLSSSERKRAAWFSDHPFASRTDSVGTALVGPPQGDTIGRVAVHIGRRTAMAVLLARDVGITAGARIAAGVGRAFAGGDSTIFALDSAIIGSARLVNVPARLGGSSGAVSVGMSVLGALTPTFDFSKNRVKFNRPASIAASLRLPLIRDRGVLRVLDRGRWVSLADYAAIVAKAGQSLTIDFRGGEIRVQP